MATATKKCKVCGNEYEYCKTNRPSGMFRWNDVACCEAHAAIYFKRIAESRNTDKNAEVVADFSDLIDDEEDELFGEYFEDEDDEAE